MYAPARVNIMDKCSLKGDETGVVTSCVVQHCKGELLQLLVKGGLCACLSAAVLAEVVCKLEEAKTALLVSMLSQMSK